MASVTVSSKVQRHNEAVFDQLEEGDLIKYDRGPYDHWAVYVGKAKVIHMTGLQDDGHVGSNSSHVFTISGMKYDKAKVCEDDFFKVAEDSKAYKDNYKDKDCRTYSPSEIVKRAKSKIGRASYNVLWNNCEHFATWCRYDVGISEQADNVLTGVAVGLTIAVVVLGLAWLFGGKKSSQSERKRKT